jgi:hypothetical protein
MRKLVVLVLSAVLAACGGSNSSSNPGQSPTPLSGKINGHAFTPVETRAMIVESGPNPCPVPGFGAVWFKALMLEAATYPGACGDLTGIPHCTYRPSSQNVAVLVAALNYNPLQPGEPPLMPGTFPASPSLAAIAAGSGWAQTLDVDPASAWTTSSNVVGTIRIDAIPVSSTARVTGHLALTFDQGSAVSGDFSAEYCPTTIFDPCELTTAIVTSGLCGP